MGHRTVKRVPLDFDHPLGERWSGYVRPDALDLDPCTDCRHDPYDRRRATGYTREAFAVDHTFYPHMIGSPLAGALAWHDKLGQDEVDALVHAGRLLDLTRNVTPTVGDRVALRRAGEFGSIATLTEAAPTDYDEDDDTVWARTDNGWYGKLSDLVRVPTADEVNQWQRGRGMGHDGFNRMILIHVRCERLGITMSCPTCQGECEVGSDERRAARDAWERTEPPTGDGWQLWETVSEGSPVSPVFDSAEALADWCADNATLFADMGASRDEWLAMFQADTVDVGSLLVVEAH